MRVGKSKFKKFLKEFRQLNSTVTAYDAAVLVCCVRAMIESAAVAEQQVESLWRGASVRAITHYIAHRELAEKIALKYGVVYLTHPYHVVHLHGRPNTALDIPNLVYVPTLEQLSAIDYDR